MRTAVTFWGSHQVWSSPPEPEDERSQRNPGGKHADTVFRALVECMPDFVCLATTHGELFYLNSAARRWIGLEEDASLATVTLHDFYTDESWQELRDVAVPGVNKTGQWEGRSRLRNLKTGQQIERLDLHVPR